MVAREDALEYVEVGINININKNIKINIDIHMNMNIYYISFVEYVEVGKHRYIARFPDPLS